MERYTKFFLLIGLCLISLSLFSYKETEKDDEFRIYTKYYEKKDASSPDTENVSVDNSPTEKYILKYDTSSESIILITQKENGTEFSTTVENINPYFLTEEDIDTLTYGIELSSKEDMFRLIEDFSS